MTRHLKLKNKNLTDKESEMILLPRTRCPLCDEWYDVNNPDERSIHLHPEPQSGQPRNDWLASRLNYSDWIETTEAGKKWAER